MPHGAVSAVVARDAQPVRLRDVAQARRIIENDREINKRRYDCEEKCIELISLQAPLASDLRTLISVLHITTDLERMGDHAEGIARIALMLADEPPLKPMPDLARMAELAIEMLHGSVEAYKQRDTQRARDIVQRDDTVDELYERVYHELIMMMVGDQAAIQRCTYMTWVAHNIERVADRATNICERVVYLVEGRVQDLNVSKY